MLKSQEVQEVEVMELGTEKAKLLISLWRKFLGGECFRLHFGPTLAANFVTSCFTKAENQGDESAADK